MVTMLIFILLHLFVATSFARIEKVDSELSYFVNEEKNDGQNPVSSSDSSQTTEKNIAKGSTPHVTSLPSPSPSLSSLNSQSPINVNDEFPDKMEVQSGSVEISHKGSVPQNMNRLQHSRIFQVMKDGSSLGAGQTQLAESGIADTTDTCEPNQDTDNTNGSERSKRPVAKRNAICPLMYPSIFPVWYCLRYQELRRRAELLQQLRMNSRMSANSPVLSKSTYKERVMPLMWRFPYYSLYNPKLRSYFRG